MITGIMENSVIESVEKKMVGSRRLFVVRVVGNMGKGVVRGASVLFWLELCETGPESPFWSPRSGVEPSWLFGKGVSTTHQSAAQTVG